MFKLDLDILPTISGQCSANDHGHASRCQSMVKVVNEGDNFCLARAILIGLKYIECGEQRGPDFIAYCSAQEPHANEARQLLVDAGVSTQRDEYGIPEAKAIQRLLITRYGEQQIRLVIFSQRLNNRIAWKGWTDKAAVYNLAIYHENEHFAFIGSPQQLLKVVTHI